jgi:hypothetical protein
MQRSPRADTIANGSPKALVLRLLASGHRILFSSEKGCCGCAATIPSASKGFNSTISPPAGDRRKGRRE